MMPRADPVAAETRGPPRPLAILGASSSEMLDYYFGDQPLYHPLWASGWMARGLRREPGQGFLAHVVQALPRDATVLMNFGAADLMFGLPYKVRHSRYYDFPRFQDEVVAGIVQGVATLRDLGFARVHCAILSAIPVLPPAYWEARGILRLPPPLLGQMLADLADRITAAGLPLLSLLPGLVEAPERPVLHRRFARATPDHHLDYIASRPVLQRALAALPDLPPPRDPPLTAHYPHQPYPVTQWQLTGQPRPRSLR